MDAKDYKDEPPSAKKVLDEGYNQTYVILSSGSKPRPEGNEVLFRCGNWCYKGLVQFSGLNFNTEEIPMLIPTLQKQQGSLRYYCTSKTIPDNSEFYQPLRFIEDSVEFIAKEITSDSVDKELRKMANIFPWIDDDNSSTYFELTVGELPEFMNDVSIVASKTYTRGLIILSIYFDRSIYCLIQGGEGDQPLLDVRFPDISKHGQGLHINSYSNDDRGYKKLTLWHVVDVGNGASFVRREIPKIKTLNVSTSNYEQTYCILKSTNENDSPLLSVYHDSLFRFGSWCYSGRVQLTPTLTLPDVPYVIPALRMQQSRLDFYCDVNNVPVTSPFAFALEYVRKITPLIEHYIEYSEAPLKALIDRLSEMGVGESVSKWLDGDPANSFFEFKLSPTPELIEKFANLEMIVSKCYYPSGVVTIMIIFQFTIYVSVLESTGENPLLDSRFPDVSGKGRGYQLQAFNEGVDEWPELRKLSIWQTIGALEQEFREKAALYAQSKRSVDEDGDEDEDSENDDKDAYRNLQDKDYPEDKDDEEDVDPELANNELLVIAKPDDKSSTPEPSSHMHISAASSSPISRPQEKMSPLSDKKLTSLHPIADSKSDPLERPKQALPHHLPKDALSNRLDEIRKNLGDGGLRAPWDSAGKPLGGLSPLKK